jgi:hypothetical protein
VPRSSQFYRDERAGGPGFAGCPILSRTWRKGGSPPASPPNRPSPFSQPSEPVLCVVIDVQDFNIVILHGRWPAHQSRRITMSYEKLCPVHRSFIAMSGRAAQVSPGAPSFRALGERVGGRWPAHQSRRITMSYEKLCPVHRSFIAMSGRAAQVSPGAPSFRALGERAGAPRLRHPTVRLPAPSHHGRCCAP